MGREYVLPIPLWSPPLVHLIVKWKAGRGVGCQGFVNDHSTQGFLRKYTQFHPEFSYTVIIRQHFIWDTFKVRREKSLSISILMYDYIFLLFPIFNPCLPNFSCAFVEITALWQVCVNCDEDSFSIFSFLFLGYGKIRGKCLLTRPYFIPPMLQMNFEAVILPSSHRSQMYCHNKLQMVQGSHLAWSQKHHREVHQSGRTLLGNLLDSQVAGSESMKLLHVVIDTQTIN